MRKLLLLIAACISCFLSVTGTARAQERERAATAPPAAAPPADAIRMLEAGAVAPDFSIRDADGVPFRLADERGKRPVLLVFWSMFCEPCRLELPLLQKMHVRHKDSGLEVVGVSLDGGALAGTIRGFVKQEGYTFKVLIDEPDAKESFKAADPYGVAGMPALFLVDRAGRIVLAKTGRMKEEELEKAVQAVLKR